MTIHDPIGVETATYLSGVGVEGWGSGRRSRERDKRGECGEAESPSGGVVVGDSSRRRQR